MPFSTRRHTLLHPTSLPPPRPATAATLSRVLAPASNAAASTSNAAASNSDAAALASDAAAASASDAAAATSASDASDLVPSEKKVYKRRKWVSLLHAIISPILSFSLFNPPSLAMAAPSLPLNEDIKKCFSEWSESSEQNIIGINKFKKEIEKLKVKREGRVTTDKVIQWLSDLQSLEGQAASILENIKRISRLKIIKIGPWRGPGAHSYDFWEWVCIVKVKVYTGDVVNGLEITYEDGNTYPAGSLVRKLNEFELESGEYINWLSGSFTGYDGRICISELEFKTNFGKQHGPFGPGGGEKFTVPLSGRAVGFFGEYDRYMNSIGVYVLTSK